MSAYHAFDGLGRLCPYSACALVAAALGLASSPANAVSIVEIEIKPNSQSTLSRPAIDNTYRVEAVGGVLNINLGIGIIANPTFLSANDHTDFALHQDSQPNSTYYSNYVPDAESSTVYFRFDAPAIVRYVDIVQHFYGATKVAGAAGPDRNSLTALGSVFGPAGDQTTGVLGPDGTIHRFDLGNTSVAGTWFAMTIDKGNFPSAFAIHRALLFDSQGNRIAPAVPEPATHASMLAGLALLFVAARWRARV
jgi:PEP-CTERM motif